MKTIITACCPFGNLEKVLLILQQAGLEVDREFFALLHDKLVGAAYSGDPLEINQNVLQGSLLEDDITSILAQSDTGPRLLTDSRCLWLLDFWAKKLPEAKFLLFYTNAESALTSACRQEIDPQQALKTWQDSSRHLLNFQRYHRRRALLLDADAAIRQPQALIDICQLIGLTLEYSPQSEAPVLDQAILERYLARNLIASQPEIQSLQTELEASAQPLGNLPLLEIEALEVLSKMSQRLAQQRKLQDESDQLTKALDDQRNLNAEQQARLENVQQSHQTLETTTAAVTQENELLLLQLEMVQEEREQTSLQKHQLEQQVEKDKVIQQQFQAQIDQLCQARDEQLKSSAEQQTKLENVQQSHRSLEATAKEVSQKNENLAKQLSQVQEQLDRSSVQRQQLEQQTKENQAIAQHFQGQVAQLSRARDEQVKLNTEQQAKLEKAQHSHQSLQATISKLDTTVQEITRKKEQLSLQLDQVLAELKKTLIGRQQLEQQAEKDKVIRQELEARGDRLSQARDEQVKLNTEHQAKLDRMQQSNKTLQATVMEVSQKNEHLLKQLHRVQEELEKIFLQKKQLEQQTEKDKVIRQELEAQVGRLSQVREEQLNLNTEQKAKLDKVQQAHQKLDENVKEIIQENELLLEQLHQVQEELERTYLHKQQLERQAHHDLETIKNEKDQELKKAKDQLKQVKDEIIRTKDELKLAKVELTNKSRDLEKYHLHQIVREKSLAWKISTPMRAIAKPFKKKSRDQESTQEQIDLLRACGLFDESWYTATNEDIAKEGSDPIEHYIRFGAAEGRDPSSAFSTLRYLEHNPDVVEAGMNPLVHYAKYGMAEKRFKKLSKDQGTTEEQIDLLRTCGLFDEAWYLAANEDVAKEGCDPVEHYIRFGAAEGRDPSPVFSTRSYLEHNPDVAEAGMNPLVHYAKYGTAEKRFIGQL